MKNPTIPRLERVKPLELALTNDQRMQLMATAQSPGYLILLKLMETICIMQEIKNSDIEPGDEKKIVAEHGITVAKWEMFKAVQEQVAKEVEAVSQQGALDLRTEDEKEATRILNP
jgi:hypothetical protein